MPANFVSLGRSAGLYSLDPHEFDSKEELRLVARQNRQIERQDRGLDQHGRFMHRGSTAKQGIMSLFGADKSHVHANKVTINSNINEIAVRVAEGDSYRKIYRGSTLTNREVAALMNTVDTMSLESNATAAYFLLHGHEGNGYPPSFSTDRRVTEPYAKTDLRNWPEHVNTVLITVEANGPDCRHGEGFTGALHRNTGALGVTTEYHPYGRRHEVVLDNRNTYHITACRLTDHHLEVTMVASGETDRGRRARARAHDLADRALQPPPRRHQRTHSMPANATRPALGVPTDVRQLQHQARLDQARHAQAAQFVQAQPVPQWLPPAHVQPQFILQPPPPPPQPLIITDPRIAVVPPLHPYIVPPGWTAHVDQAGYTRFLPVQYVYYPAPKKKGNILTRLFKG